MPRKIVSFLCLALSAGAFFSTHAADTTFAIVSGKDNYWKPGTITDGSGGTTVTVNDTKKYQTWRGFAGTFNEAGWDALKVLPKEKQDEAMKLLFDRKNGIGFQWGRIPIGASDYALERYSLDDGQGDDLTMSRFSVARDGGCLIPFIKAAQAIKPDIKFWASPWTPPPWMKEKTIAGSSGYDGGVMRNNTDVFKAHALYFSKFIKAYDSAGIPINAVCPQNEPGYTRNYPTCGWGKYNDQDGKDYDDPEYLSTFVADYLYPKLKTDNPKTEIWFGTLSNDKTAPGYWNAMKTKAGSNLNTMIKGLGLQWNNITLVKANAKPDFFVFCSEHKCGNYYWSPNIQVNTVDLADSTHYLTTTAPNNFSYGVESWGLFKAWIDTGANLYSAWNMVLDTKGLNLNTAQAWPQNALLVVDRSAKTLTATAYYYVMRHIGQYVDSGAVRLDVGNAYALAFQNPNGSIVTIVHNTTTSAAQTTISVKSKNYKLSIPAKGFATLYAGPAPVKATEYNVREQFVKSDKNIRITAKTNGYSVALPSSNAGHIELLTATGRVLESKAFPQGSREIQLGKQASYNGLLIVKVVSGSETSTARLIATR